MKASKQSVKKLVVLGMYSGAPHNASWSQVPNFIIVSRAKVQRRTDSFNIDPKVEAEELRVRLQRHRQRHQARLQKKCDDQKESVRIAHQEHRAKMQQMQEEHQPTMRKIEEEHQPDMKIHEERVKIQMEEFERLKMLQQEQILQINEAISILEDKARNS